MSNIQQRKVAELYPHPKNQSIYGDEDIKELAQSIEEQGLNVALLIRPDGRIISGHRRWKAVKLLGWETVNVIQKEFTDDAEELKTLLIRNEYRTKTNEQKCREGLLWEDIEAANSRKLMGVKGKGEGLARNRIATKVGFTSGANYHKARLIVTDIDKAEEVGDFAKAQSLRKVLNEKSVNAAFEMRAVLSAIDEAEESSDIATADALRKVLDQGISVAHKMLNRNRNESETEDTQTHSDINKSETEDIQTQSGNNQAEAEHIQTEIDVKQSKTQHTQTQWVLAKLGQKLCGSVWIAPDNHSDIWDNEKLGGFSIDALPYLGIGNPSQKTVKYIDVVWLSGDNQVAAAFEVECSTSIYSGLLRLADLVALSPNLNFPVYIILPKSRVKDVKKELSRACFKSLKLDKKCRWICIEDLLKDWEAIIKFGTDLDAISGLSHNIDSFKINHDD